MNGDRYPDQVSTGAIVFNHGTPGSGFDDHATDVNMGIAGEGSLRKTDSKSVSLSFGAGTMFAEPRAKKTFRVKSFSLQIVIFCAMVCTWHVPFAGFYRERSPQANEKAIRGGRKIRLPSE
jgi:hypothetical protein